MTIQCNIDFLSCTWNIWAIHMTLCRVCCIEYIWLFANAQCYDVLCISTSKCIFFLLSNNLIAQDQQNIWKIYEENVCISVSDFYMKIINNKHTMLYNRPTIHWIQRPMACVNWPIISQVFLGLSFNPCGIHFVDFLFFPTAFNRSEIVCCAAFNSDSKCLHIFFLQFGVFKLHFTHRNYLLYIASDITWLPYDTTSIWCDSPAYLFKWKQKKKKKKMNAFRKS